MNDTTMTVLVIEPGKEPFLKQIQPGLESLQCEVGGSIQAIYPFEDPVAIICDEDGKYKGYALNRALRDEAGEIYDVLTGTFLITGLSPDSFDSLSEELAEKFKAFFRYPELFYWQNEKIHVLTMKAPKTSMGKVKEWGK